MPEKLSEFTGEVNPRVVEVNGVRLNLKEFDMRTRALWIDVSNEYNLTEEGTQLQNEILPRVVGLSYDIEADPRVKSAKKRMDVLQERHDKLIEVYATPDEPDDIDEQLEAIVERMSEQSSHLSKIMTEVQSEVSDQASMAERAVSSFMEKQDKARVDFVWRLAKALKKTDMEFEEFFQRCDGDDYAEAERFVTEGNARWASLYANRMQRKPKKNLN